MNDLLEFHAYGPEGHSSKDTEMMKIMNREGHYPCPDYVPFKLLCEIQAEKNHGRQSLKRLNERGGLSPLECFAVMEQLDFHQVRNIGEKDAARLLTKRLLIINNSSQTNT